MARPVTTDNITDQPVNERITGNGDAITAPTNAPDDSPFVPLDKAKNAKNLNLESGHLSELMQTKRLLDAAEKVSMVIPQAGPNGTKLPDIVVTINDYAYQIKRGKMVRVPRPVYEVLVQSGHVAPLTEEDESMSPVVDPVVAQASRFSGVA
jgi:hypothetical protein